ncbi:MAG: GNAT family N-acetyltransferase [Bacilli bacterium]|nr:GNAT family N-acetyltransferase [Bacilli bacterium]
MKLNYIEVNNDYKYKGKVKYLFEHAFPKVERPTFNQLMSFKNHVLYAVELDKEFVALVDLIINKDTTYVFFLAVKKTMRGQNVGSQILKFVSDKYNNYRIYLLAESPNEECTNLLEREHRISFYKKNGFIESDVSVNEYGTTYLILYKNGKVNKIELLESMKFMLGEATYLKYYEPFIK